MRISPYFQLRAPEGPDDPADMSATMFVADAHKLIKFLEDHRDNKEECARILSELSISELADAYACCKTAVEVLNNASKLFMVSRLARGLEQNGGDDEPWKA